MQRELVYYPNDILRQKTHDVREFDDDLTQLAGDMRVVMKQHNGMGLAAPQVNDPRRVIVVEYTPTKESEEKAIPFTAFVNPQIIATSKSTDDMNEGCLSIPYVEVPIIRPTEVTVAAQDLQGHPIKVRAKGLFARILQHEIDHLNGKLVLDYEPNPDPSELAQSPKTIVWGSTEFTAGVLNILRGHIEVTHIVTEPPKPSGRKGELTPTVAQTYAKTLSIPTIEPTDLNDPKLYNYFLSLKPDLMIVAAYGRLITEAIFNLPKFGTLNVHPSLLPKYRGATPIQAAILNGDKETGVTIMKLSPQFDTGEIVAAARYELDGTETYEDLEIVLSELGAEILKEVLPDYLAGNIMTMPQENAVASSTKKITLADRWLNPNDSAVVNERKVRAYAPAPSAFVILDGAMVKILQAHIEDDNLVFDTIQPAGKSPMSWLDFVRGYRKELRFQPIESILNK